MVGNFYRIQSWFENKNFYFVKKITYRVLLILIRIIVPFYYSFIPLKLSGLAEKNKVKKENRIIVSLTSFPPRMNNLWIVLESLFRQTQKPDKIILWLASSQFPSINDVDRKVLAMKKKGLEIRFCDDLRSHKKYFYTMQEFKDDIVITVDDDVFYPENMVETLLDKHYEYRDSIVCYRAHRITFIDGNINKYIDWDYAVKNVTEPDNLLVPTGCGGVLYPPYSLSLEAFDIQEMLRLCPNADDIWLKCMAYKNGTKSVLVSDTCSEMFTTRSSGESDLARSNVMNGENDVQLRKVIERYSLNFSKAIDWSNSDG